MVIELTHSNGDLLSRISWLDVAVTTIYELKKHNGQVLHFLVPG